MSHTATLYFVHDPMCSWCWGFNHNWQVIKKALPNTVRVQRIVGGLAPDCDEPMPMPMREKLQQIWQQVSETTGASFNYDFWHHNTPYRSTYPACRALICANNQDKEEAMVSAIQQAYYQKAQNVSLLAVLIDCAKEIACDVKRFKKDMQDEATEIEFRRQLAFARSIGGNSFPSLFLQRHDNQKVVALPLSYTDSDVIMNAINQILH